MKAGSRIFVHGCSSALGVFAGCCSVGDVAVLGQPALEEWIQYETLDLETNNAHVRTESGRL